MSKYRVLATEYGLNFNGEFIIENALKTFPSAFPSGTPSFFGHKQEDGDYVPQVGTITDSFVDGNRAYVIIDFNDEITAELEAGRHFNVSVCSRVKSQWNEQGHLDILEFVPDKINSVDIVKYGAVPNAKVEEKIADNVTEIEFIVCSRKLEVQKVEDKVIVKQLKKGGTMTNDEKEELVTSVKDAVISALSTVADEKQAQDQQEQEQVADVTEKIAVAFIKGANAGLNVKSVQRVANSIKADSDIDQLIADEKMLVDEILADAKGDESVNGLRQVEDSGATQGISDPFVSRVFANAMKGKDK